MGFCKNDRSYLANGWNVLDFSIVLITTIFILFHNLDFTMLRFLRLIEKFEGIFFIKR